MFGLTLPYFCLYHSLSNMAIRATLRATRRFGRAASLGAAATVVVALAYSIALMETVTIAHVRPCLPLLITESR